MDYHIKINFQTHKFTTIQNQRNNQGIKRFSNTLHVAGHVVQSVTCLATDASLTANPRVASSIHARSRTFVEIDHEIILRSFTSLPLNHSRRVVVRYKRKYVQEVLVNRLFKLAKEKVWLGELTIPP